MFDDDDGDSYRKRKEASVSDLAGTTMLELVLVSTPIPTGIWLLAELKALATALGGGKNMAPQPGWQLFTLEALVILFPALASTLWPSHVMAMVLSMTMSSVCCRLWRSSLKNDKTTHRAEAKERKNSHEERRDNRLALPAMEVVTNFRASIMIITCITILAVDFQVFPRRFAKTEIFGTGLMDLGVGATVFARHLLALISMCVYQWLLVNGGLSDFIVDAPRDTLFSMNREGVLGLVGFVAIFYIAEELGSQVRIGRNKTEKRFTERRPSSKCIAIVMRATVILWVLTLFSEGFIHDTSRRMVNLTYVLWVSAHSSLMLSLLMLFDIISSKSPRSQILSSTNFNLFPVFMVANLATGAINLSMRTLDADTFTAVIILSFYVVFVAGFAVILMDRWGVKLRV